MCYGSHRKLIRSHSLSDGSSRVTLASELKTGQAYFILLGVWRDWIFQRLLVAFLYVAGEKVIPQLDTGILIACLVVCGERVVMSLLAHILLSS